MMNQARLLPALLFAPSAIVFAQAGAAPATQITLTPAGSQKVIVGKPHGASPTSSVIHIALQEEQNGVKVI